MTDVRAQKSALRAKARAILRALPAQDIARASEIIARHIEAWDGFALARAVLIFLPIPGECDLRPLARRAVTAGKRIYIPRVGWETSHIVPVRIHDPDADAPPDDRGVPTPRADLPDAALSEIDLILAPGLSFDRRGGRLGRSGGFYDRLLSDPACRAKAIGVALEAQIVEAAPTEAHDQPVDGLVTEDGLILFEDLPPARPI